MFFPQMSLENLEQRKLEKETRALLSGGEENSLKETTTKNSHLESGLLILSQIIG